MVTGCVTGTETWTPHDCLVEPSKLVVQKDAVLEAGSLCQHSQLKKTAPVEIYNPSDEPV